MLQQKQSGIDKGTIIGFVLIGLILVLFSIYNSPTQKEKDELKRKQDSVLLASNNVANDTIKQYDDTNIDTLNTVSAIIDDTTESLNTDSLKQNRINKKMGVFADKTVGENKFITIENDLIEAKISAKGGFISQVRLKKFRTYDSLPLVIFNNENTSFNLSFLIQDTIINTKDLYFTTDKTELILDKTNKSGIISFKIAIDKNKYIEYKYTLKNDDYIVDFDINIVGLNKVIPRNVNYLLAEWNMKTHSLEKSLVNERNASTVYYCSYNDMETDYLSETESEKNDNLGNLKWISYKQQFFTTVLIAKGETKLEDCQAEIAVPEKTETSYVKDFSSKITFPYNPEKNNEKINLSYYFGPNRYSTLSDYDIKLERQIPLGWGFFPISWVNQWIVIPVFNFLDGFNLNYGIIILLLTIFIKLILFPIAYKTYLSSAKMKVLKPDVDELSAKYPKTEDAAKKQQAVMGLYKRAGVNPLAGCVPMLLQMPILYALFKFFPASIELRQQPFLWAEDLSSYDSIYSWSTYIWGISDFYGNHISLFTILMTISMIYYTKMNNEMMSSSQQLPGMKTMMYLMPVMFMAFLNSYSAGLSYYYFLANMITFGQQWAIKKFFVDEAKILKQIRINQKKPVVKSKWQLKMEELAKQKGR